jgi:hypothetical protein
VADILGEPEIDQAVDGEKVQHIETSKLSGTPLGP